MGKTGSATSEQLEPCTACLLEKRLACSQLGMALCLRVSTRASLVGTFFFQHVRL